VLISITKIGAKTAGRSYMRTSIDKSFRVLVTVVIATITSGCEAIGAIFKAGVWTGAIAVVALLVLVAVVVMKIGRS
jgi:hypothetical protein